MKSMNISFSNSIRIKVPRVKSTGEVRYLPPQ